MKRRFRKISIALMSILTVLTGAACVFTGCESCDGDGADNGDNPVIEIPGNDGEQTTPGGDTSKPDDGNGQDKTDGTEQTKPDDGSNDSKPSEGEDDKYEYDSDYHWKAATSKALHTYVLDSSKSTAADCTKGGVDVYVCSDCGAEKKVDTAQTEHTYGDPTVVEPTCVESGYTSKVCTKCKVEVKSDYVLPAGHKFSEATCTSAQICTVCGATGAPKLDHVYELVEQSSKEATCFEEGYDYYECSLCHNDHYTVTVAKTAHDFVWTEDNEAGTNVVGTTEVCYQKYLKGECVNEGCTESQEKTENITDHTYVSAITTPATCSTAGVKTYTCSICGVYYTESYTDSDAHDWQEGEPDANGVVTYTCKNDSTHTKTAVVYDNTSATVDATTLKTAGEVSLGGTSIALDESAKNVLEGKDNVEITADVLSSEDLADLNLSEQDAAIIGDVYNFTMKSGDDYITNFDGSVTVTIPYTLEDGEDPDNLVIWYVNSEGELEQIENGKYSNGYAIFTTTHFSFYSVTRMTPAQRCEKFGHSIKTVSFDPTCFTAGYTLTMCTRCGDYKKEDVPANEHEWQITVKSQATCETAGETEYYCPLCTTRYTVTTPATGHDWVESSVVAATCAAKGYTTYTCANGCGKTYTKEEAQKKHSFKVTTYQVTCTSNGYTHKECVSCGEVNDVDFVQASGHTFVTRTVAPTCTEQGYTAKYCSVCGVEQEKTDVVAAKGHTMVNGVCSVCGEGCEHNYTSLTVAPTCTDKGYTVYTCSKCSSTYNSDYTDALGHDFGLEECARCHTANPNLQKYYTNMISSLVDGSIYLKLSNVEVSFGEYETEYDEEGNSSTEITWYGKVKQLDIINLYFMIASDGSLEGYGNGKVNYIQYYSDGTENVNYNVTATYLVANGKLYVLMQSDMLDMSDMVGVLDLNYALYSIGNGQITYQTIKDYLVWINSDVANVVENVFNSNTTAISNSVKLILNNLFTVEELTDGYRYTLDLAKLADVNDKLKDATVESFVNSIMGANSYTTLTQVTIPMLLKNTPAQAIQGIKAMGLDRDEICSAIDGFMYLYYGQSFDSSKMLDQALESFDSTATFGDILADALNSYMRLEGDSAITSSKLIEQIKTISTEYKDAKVYDLIAMALSSYVGDMSADDLYTMVKSAVDMATEYVGDDVAFNFTVDKDGNVKTATLDIDKDDLIVYSGSSNSSDSSTTTGSASTGSVVVDGSYVDYGDSEESGTDSSTDSSSEYGDIADVKVTIQLVNDTTPQYDIATIVNKVNSKLLTLPANSIITIKGDDEKTYSTEYPAIWTYNNGSEVRIHTDANGNIIKIVSVEQTIYRSVAYVRGNVCVATESSYTYTYDYIASTGYAISAETNVCKNVDMMAIAFIANETYSWSGNISVNINLQSGAEISRSGGRTETKDYGTEYKGVTIYYNTQTKEYSLNSPHDFQLVESKSNIVCGGFKYYECTKCGENYTSSIGHLDYNNTRNEYTYLKEGSTNCEDGVVETVYCNDCNEALYAYTYYGHYINVKHTVNLSDYGSKEDDVLIYTTCLCEKSIEYIDGYLYGYGYVGFISNYMDLLDSKEYRPDGVIYNGTYVYTYTCPVTGCGFVFAIYETSYTNSKCEVTTEYHLMLNVNIDKQTNTVLGLNEGGKDIVVAKNYSSNYNHSEEITTVNSGNTTTTTYTCTRCGMVTSVHEITTTSTQTVEKYTYYREMDVRTQKVIKYTVTYTTNYSNGKQTSYVRYWVYYQADGKTISSTEKDEYTYDTSIEKCIKEVNTYIYYYTDHTYKSISTWTYTYSSSTKTAQDYVRCSYYNDVLTSKNTESWTYSHGYSFVLYDYYYDYNESGDVTSWRKYDYVYAGENKDEYCTYYVIYTNSDNDYEVDPTSEDHVTKGDYAIQPTCTQNAYGRCIFCGQLSEISGSAYGHDYSYNYYTDLYECTFCGLQGENQGMIMFEDLSYRTDGDYEIGYLFANWSGTYDFSIWLNEEADEEGDYNDYDITDVLDIIDSNKDSYLYNWYSYISGNIKFSAADVNAAIANLREQTNYTGTYTLTVYFVSESYAKNNVYAITIDLHDWVEGSVLEYNISTNTFEPKNATYCSICGQLTYASHNSLELSSHLFNSMLIVVVDDYDEDGNSLYYSKTYGLYMVGNFEASSPEICDWKIDETSDDDEPVAYCSEHYHYIDASLVIDEDISSEDGGDVDNGDDKEDEYLDGYTYDDCRWVYSYGYYDDAIAYCTTHSHYITAGEVNVYSDIVVISGNGLSDEEVDKFANSTLDSNFEENDDGEYENVVYIYLNDGSVIKGTYNKEESDFGTDIYDCEVGMVVFDSYYNSYTYYITGDTSSYVFVEYGHPEGSCSWGNSSYDEDTNEITSYCGNHNHELTITGVIDGSEEA